MRSNSLVVALVSLIMPLAASSAELSINPGLWETTMTQTNPMTGEPTTETNTRCVKATGFDPNSMMQKAKGCELVEDELNGDTLSFRMECSMEQGMKATVEGEFQTDGRTGQGNMDMNMNMGEINMTMNMNWTSKRLGGC